MSEDAYRQAAVEALSVAAEFLLCAIRAASNGADLNGNDVRKPIEWAVSKLEGAGLFASPADARTPIVADRFAA